MSDPVDSAVLQALDTAAERFSIVISDDGRASLVWFAQELIRWNRTINLTSITDPAGVAELHILDSLAVAKRLPSNATVVDVGTGGGLPGIPLAVARPDCSFRLIDRTEKKVFFLKNVAARMALKNVEPMHVRLEGNPEKEKLELADVAISRAFTSAPEWIRLARNYVRPGGLIVAMLGAEDPDPVVLEAALGGGLILAHERYELPSGSRRGLILVETPA